MTNKPQVVSESNDSLIESTAEVPETQTESSDDVTPQPDDFDDLRLDQSFEGGAVKKIVTVIPIKKPPKQAWIRVHPDLSFRRDMHLLELRDDREVYGVTAAVAPYATEEIYPVTLFAATTRQGSIFLWPCRLPGADGRDLDWYRSARLAAEQAQRCWVRVTANLSAGSYDVAVPLVGYPPPEWPELSFRQMLEIAFRGKLIKTLDHPVLLRLQGRA